MDFRGRLRLLWGVLLIAACNRSALPLPLAGPNKRQVMPVIVPYPPPPARPEIVPPKPGDRVVWVDGMWMWDRRRWVWQSGRWEAPPTGAHYAPWKIVHLPDGSLGYFPGGWQMQNKKAAPVP